MASSLTEPFVSAISNKEIESTIIVGESADSTFKYSFLHGDRTLLDGKKQPLAEDDLLFLASATKVITTIAALQCVERGQLSLKGDTKSIIPELSEMGILTGLDDNGKVVIEPNTKPITLEHLLTHSSGLTYDFFNPALQQWAKENPAKSDLRRPSERFCQPLTFAPGEGWMYGPGIDWAGILVERVSGLELDEYFRQHILSPLGVSSSDLTFYPIKEGRGDRMVDLNPSDPKGLGLSVGGGNSMHEGVSGAFGGHGGYATAHAVLAVLHSVLANDEKLLSKASVDDMFKTHLEETARKKFQELQATPMGMFFGQDVCGEKTSFGLGGLLVGDHPALGEGSLTWGGGINSVWFIDPKNKLCGFAAPQMGMPPNQMKAFELKTVVRHELHAAKS